MLLKTIKGCSVCTVYLYLSVSSGGTWLIADQPLILEYKFAIIETYTLDFLLYILNLYLYNLYSSPQIYIFVFSQKLDNMHVWDGHQEIVFLTGWNENIIYFGGESLIPKPPNFVPWQSQWTTNERKNCDRPTVPTMMLVAIKCYLMSSAIMRRIHFMSKQNE